MGLGAAAVQFGDQADNEQAKAEVHALAASAGPQAHERFEQAVADWVGQPRPLDGDDDLRSLDTLFRAQADPAAGGTEAASSSGEQCRFNGRVGRLSRNCRGATRSR